MAKAEAEDFEAVIAKAKHRHRPKLKDWSKDGFATRRARDFDRLAMEKCEGTELIAREPHSLSQEDFERKYERTSTPVIVAGCVEHEGWRAFEEWTSYDRLLGVRRRTGDVVHEAAELRLKCGEDDDGKNVKLSLWDFARYARTNSDDSPLYVFDQGFADRRGGKELVLDAFAVPRFCAKHDLFDLMVSRRPPHRWWLLGPKRSGTCVHVDPLGTSAWNTVVSGRKRWVLFEPATTKAVAKGTKLVGDDEDDEASNYFVDILPRIRARHPFARRIECVQHPGETIFVPGGWWHAVVNLDDTVGVTQNLASYENFDAVWEKTRTGRRGMAHKWLRRLAASGDANHRELARRAMKRPPLSREKLSSADDDDDDDDDRASNSTKSAAKKSKGSSKKHKKHEQKKAPDGNKPSSRARDEDHHSSSSSSSSLNAVSTTSSPKPGRPDFRRDKSPELPRDFADRKRTKRRPTSSTVSDDDDRDGRGPTSRSAEGEASS